MITESRIASAFALDRAVYGTDEQLVVAVRRGEDRAFERLYERYQRRIGIFVYGMVHDHGRAEDVTQEVFISALRRMRQTDRPIAFKPWIYEIAKNACIDQFRRTRRTEEISYDAEDGVGALESTRLASPNATPDDAVDAKQQLNDLCGAFGGLSDTHHEILVLRELEGLSYREIGERLGLSRPSVESTLFRARRRLTEEYDELVSGERCLRVQAMLTTAPRGLGARDERRLARHIAHCQPCRRQAAAAGLDTAAIAPRRRAIAARVAAFLPLPAFLRLRRGSSPLSDGQTATLAQWSGTVSSMSEPALGWTKAAVAAATLLIAGGAGVAGHPEGPPVSRALPVAAPVHNVVEPAAAKPAAAKHRRPAAGRVKAKPATQVAVRRERRAKSAKPAGPGRSATISTAKPAPPAPVAGRPTAPTGGPAIVSADRGAPVPNRQPQNRQPTPHVGPDPLGQIQNTVTMGNGPTGDALGDARSFVGVVAG